MPTYSNTDSRALRSGAVEPRNVPPARRRPGAGGVAVDRKDITGIVTHCRFVAQEYAAMRIFVKNPYQIYQLNNTAKKYTDELLSLLFQKFSGDLSEISRVANKLSLAHKTLSTRFTGAAAGIPFYKGAKSSDINYGPPEIVATAITYANKDGNGFMDDVDGFK